MSGEQTRILTVRPEPGEYAWTFGGVPPVARIAPGTVLDLYTEDCFAGRVRSEKDLVSEVCEFPYLNPQTGPFHIEGSPELPYGGDMSQGLSGVPLFVHGSVRDPDEYILNGAVARENLAVLTADYPNVQVCFFGHTHVKTVVPSPDGPSSGSHDTLDLSSGGPYLVNPGSVGQPRDGDTFASYVLAENTQNQTRIAYRFVEYDVEKAQGKIRAAGLPGMLADRLALGR